MCLDSATRPPLQTHTWSNSTVVRIGRRPVTYRVSVLVPWCGVARLAARVPVGDEVSGAGRVRTGQVRSLAGGEALEIAQGISDEHGSILVGVFIEYVFETPW